MYNYNKCFTLRQKLILDTMADMWYNLQANKIDIKEE